MREREGGESQKAFDMREAKLETLRRRGEEVQQIKRDAFYLGGCDTQDRGGGEGLLASEVTAAALSQCLSSFPPLVCVR